MARINKNGTLSGLMGNVVLRSYNEATFAYVRPDKVKNPRTRGQMMQRTKKQNIVNLYGKMKPALKDNFQGKVGKQSDYTMFVSCNLSQPPVFLTEREAQFGATQIVAPYVVSFGKMSPIEYELQDGWLVSDLKAESLKLSEKTMVLDLTSTIISENEDWREGDIIEFICCYQRTEGTNNPQAECEFANIELDNEDRHKLRSRLENIEIKVNESGYLCMRTNGEGGFAMIHKRQSAKGIMAGTQNLVVNSNVLDHYCSEEHCDEAIKSYEKKK